MPIEGRTHREASHTYRETLNRLLAHTITRTPLIVIHDRHTDVARISFRRGGYSSATTLTSRYGPIGLYIRQTLDANEGQQERVRLRVIDYQYTITPLGADDPLFRWEFVRFPSSGSFWCRNHLQGPIDIGVGGRMVNLNDWHLPTGWGPIEEVIRFGIVDLGVPPLDTSADPNGGHGWHARLSEHAESNNS